jgi:three-Cys-motif partner protein
MSKYDDDFFEGKRPWSLIKDEILGSYIPAYINKVKGRGQPIVLIDGYAGPGVFNDGSQGSPMIICSAAEKFARGRYSAHFFNIEKKHHTKLESVIQHAGWSHSAYCYHGNSLKYIKQIPQILKDHTVFLYLDPFGLKGCEFDQLEPFLQRDPLYSTEIVLTICMPVLHRLASFKAIKDGRQNDVVIQAYHQILTSTLGDDSWKAFMLQDFGAEYKERQFITAYVQKIRNYMPFTGFCPVRDGNRIKYFIVFASRHPHAMLLMNDIMVNAYFRALHKAEYTGTLFENFDWKDMPTTEDRGTLRLDHIILDLIAKHPGETRNEIWLKLIQERFMCFLHSEYLTVLKELQHANKLQYPSDPVTKKHNGMCKLYPIAGNY